MERGTVYLKSTNFSTTAGSEVDLNAGTITLGGSANPGFTVDADGFVNATNIAENYVVVTTANSSSYFSNSGTTGVNLVFDGSLGGEVTMNMQLDARPYNTAANSGTGGFRPIKGIILPSQATGINATADVVINVDNVTFDDDVIAGGFGSMAK